MNNASLLQAIYIVIFIILLIVLLRMAAIV